jgi:3-dehydroquinate synthase
MVQAFRLSERLKHCKPGTADRVARHLKTAGLPTHVTDIEGSLPAIADLVNIMKQDKKAQSGKLTFILARAIGDAFIARNVPDSAVADFLAEDVKRK